jgi:hypothetical protein
MIKKFLQIFIIVLLTSCHQDAKPVKIQTESVAVPSFSPDSAYNYIQKQVSFGPRIPNTLSHQNCASYLADKLKNYGADVIEQKAELRAFDGTILHAVNIIGSFNTHQKNRILLFAHWDTRPWSDHDPDPKNYRTPLDGANDGASGVGVLLEIARQIGIKSPTTGVDIIFFDAEDYGAPSGYQGDVEDSWCLGTQYWAENPHQPGYKAKYGILLDMVGAPDATFMREQISEYYAPDVVNKIWNYAAGLGFEKYFINKQGGAVTDDHLYVNKLAGIPSIDIIHYSPQNKNGFGDYWHTTNDNMSNIDKNTLFAVGTTLMKVIYNEK